MMDIGLITGYVRVALSPLLEPAAAEKILVGIYMHNGAAPYNGRFSNAGCSCKYMKYRKCTNFRDHHISGLNF